MVSNVSSALHWCTNATPSLQALEFSFLSQPRWVNPEARKKRSLHGQQSAAQRTQNRRGLKPTLNPHLTTANSINVVGSTAVKDVAGKGQTLSANQGVAEAKALSRGQVTPEVNTNRLALAARERSATPPDTQSAGCRAPPVRTEASPLFESGRRRGGARRWR
jgi:hypothetical protein